MVDSSQVSGVVGVVVIVSKCFWCVAKRYVRLYEVVVVARNVEMVWWLLGIISSNLYIILGLTLRERPQTLCE